VTGEFIVFHLYFGGDKPKERASPFSSPPNPLFLIWGLYLSHLSAPGRCGTHRQAETPSDSPNQEGRKKVKAKPGERASPSLPLFGVFYIRQFVIQNWWGANPKS